MKYRIIQTGIDEFWVQKRFLCFWYKIIRTEVPFSKYCFAKDALIEYTTFKENIIDGDKILEDYYERVAQNYCTNPFKDTVVPDMMHGPVKMNECVLGGDKTK